MPRLYGDEAVPRLYGKTLEPRVRRNVRDFTETRIPARYRRFVQGHRRKNGAAERLPRFCLAAGYYEHVIRDEVDLARVREYIVNNPCNGPGRGEPAVHPTAREGARLNRGGRAGRAEAMPRLCTETRRCLVSTERRRKKFPIFIEPRTGFVIIKMVDFRK